MKTYIDGTEAVHEASEERSQKEVPTEFLIRLFELILENNIFEFNDTLWKQLIGAAIGQQTHSSLRKYIYGSKIRY